MRRVALSLLLSALWTLLPTAASGARAADLPGLPEGASYDPAVPTPGSVLGWEPGEWHVRPDQLIEYLTELSKLSPRVKLLEQGRTHERQRQILLVISSPENLAKLEEIRTRHQAIATGAQVDDGRERPAIAALLYSIHGNEASGSNASMVVAYHLAASRDPEVGALLRDVVVLLDPMQNPDGLARFAVWANMHRGRTPNPDPRNREHVEPWPNGRTNHYWFDLNRDWLMLVHPESRNRVETFHRFRPTVLADFHEMGSEGTFFFQPGVPSRNNPITDRRNLELTRAIARFHAEKLDEAGELYYSEEGFDDYYYGKGSTYPDAHGSIGILFEQASARGQLRETRSGPLAFRDAIANQVRTSLSTLAATRELRRPLLDYQAAAPAQARALAQRDPVSAWVCDPGPDAGQRRELLQLLAAHRIEARSLARPIDIGGRFYTSETGFAVPLDQPQARLVKALLEPVDRFLDTQFYDVSTWALPLAYDVSCAGLPRTRSGDVALGASLRGAPAKSALEPARVPPGAVAWALPWNSSEAPRVLSRLLASGVLPRVATRPFSDAGPNGPRTHERGTLVIPRGGRGGALPDLEKRMEQALDDTELRFMALSSGLTPDGVDLGSPSVPVLQPPRPLLVVGSGVSTDEAGEIWHLLDQRFEVPVSLIERDALGGVPWDEYTHLFLVDGSYGAISAAATDALRRWVRAGGVVVASKRGAEWAQRALGGEERPEGGAAGERAGGAARPQGGGGQGGSRPAGAAAPAGSARLPDVAAGQRSADAPRGDAPRGDAQRGETPAAQAVYGDYEADRAKSLVAGAIFSARFDRSHPLGFGLPRDTLPLFRNHTRKLEASDNPYENVGVYGARPLLSGYAAPDTVETIAGGAALVVRKLGGGTLVLFADDPAFRGFFHGSERLVANALFFGSAVRATAAPRTWLGSGEADPDEE